MRVYPEQLSLSLEFHRIIQEVQKYARVQESKESILSLKPVDHQPHVLQALSETNEYLNLLNNKRPFPDTEFDSMKSDLALLKADGSLLQESQFFKIRRNVVLVHELNRYFTEHAASLPALSQRILSLGPDPGIVAWINEIIEEKEPYIKISASPELSAIRKELSAKRKESEKKFKSFLNDLKKRGWLRESEESFYNGRRVISVLAEYKRDVKGIIHGTSETGKTAFIEPLLTVEVNNEIIWLEQQEKKEHIKLLRALARRCRTEINWLTKAQHNLVHIDTVRAKALYGLEVSACMPEIQKNMGFRLRNARHPVLYLQNKKSGKKTVPLNVILDANQRMLIISGPNAGGKSIALKTVGLLQIMLQSGLLVPVDEGSVMCMFHSLMGDIGDNQSIEYELSTYSSRLSKAKYFIEFAGKRSLVLIDEMGTGSDPELGGALAEAILEELVKSKCFAIVTTHYANLKMLAVHHKEVCNANMRFNPETLEPFYLLETGKPGSSYTFEVASRIGLPPELLNRARKKVDGGKLKLEKLLLQLQQEKEVVRKEADAFKQAQQNMQSKEKEYHELLEKLEEKRAIERDKSVENARLAGMGRKFEKLSEEINKGTQRKEVVARFMRMMTAEKKRMLDEQAKEKEERRKQRRIKKVAGEIKVGSRVRLINGSRPGIIEEIKKGKAEVVFGTVKMKVGLENLVALPDPV